MIHKTASLLIFLLATLQSSYAQFTLEKCQEMAQQNHPLIKKYDLVQKTAEYTVANIRNRWLPQMMMAAQVTWQSAVPSLPDALTKVMTQIGTPAEGVHPTQYRVGVDLYQMLWDGGRLRHQSEVARLQSNVEVAHIDVELYEIRQRVNELFFGLLLIDAQIQINVDHQALLQSNEEKLVHMYNNGVATQSDIDKIKAERLNAQQAGIVLCSSRETMQRMLALFCGVAHIDRLVKPSIVHVTEMPPNLRPEMRIVDQILLLSKARRQQLRSELLPNLGIFAQGYYGYPSYNMFEDMLQHRLSFNAVMGLRFTWNIGNLYSYKHDLQRLDNQIKEAQNRRDIFLFSNQMAQIQKSEEIARFGEIQRSDDAIVILRTNIRQAAESKLAYGVIDVNNLLEEITRENNARSNRSIHEIEQLKAIYELKTLTNNK